MMDLILLDERLVNPFAACATYVFLKATPFPLVLAFLAVLDAFIISPGSHSTN
jgi:hypothetical protein